MSLQEVVEAIRRHRRFLVTSHIHPEGDAVGSVLALTLGLRRLGKEVRVFLEDPVPRNLRFLPLAQEIQPWPRNGLPPVEATLVVDCGDLDRLGSQVTRNRLPGIVINIDHHATNSRFGDINWIQADATATGVMVHALLRALQVPLALDIATCLYVTLLTETGGFRYANTQRETFLIAAELLQAGVNPAAVAEAVYHQNSLSQLRLLGRLLQKIQVSRDGRLAWVTVTQRDLEDTGTSEQDLENAISYPRSLQGVAVALMFREQPNGKAIAVSLRSNTNLDVAALAREFGGGGHPRAAGFTLEGSLETVETRVLRKVRKALEGKTL